MSNFLNEIFNLKEKIIIIYGGGGKIGSYLVENLHKTGARIISISSSKKKFKDFSNNVSQYATDLSNEKSIKKNIDLIVSQEGVPDVLINCAVGRPGSENESHNLDSWKKSIDTNITGTFLLLKNYCDLMKSRKTGSIININSIYGIVAPNPNLYTGTEVFCEPDYCASKSALLGLTKYFSSIYGKHGIRTNCISPGGIFYNQNPDFVARYIRNVPLGRMANFSDLLGTIIMLSSDAGAYITGSNIVIDGGYTIR
jgi:NAD(P)-dependent dehydrogenase (short-subunit alcohol dehydrogenase family)